ncbi:MAG: hypothetical protein Q4C95_11810 [Planctomycetia bacterium]|nr:hypothetical protein [Planctomycetia bacterium]
MNNDIKIGIIAASLKQLERCLDKTGLTLVNYVGEDTMQEGTLHVYDGDNFVGAIKTSIYEDRLKEELSH